jgi:hypothetical protein
MPSGSDALFVQRVEPAPVLLPVPVEGVALSLLPVPLPLVLLPASLPPLLSLVVLLSAPRLASLPEELVPPLMTEGSNAFGPGAGPISLPAGVAASELGGACGVTLAALPLALLPAASLPAEPEPELVPLTPLPDDVALGALLSFVLLLGVLPEVLPAVP